MTEDTSLTIVLEGVSISWSTWEEIREWIKAERSALAWISNAGSPSHVAEHINQAFTLLTQNIAQIQSSHSVQAAQNHITNAFTGVLRYSRGPTMERMREISDEHGERAAAFAYALEINKTTLGKAATRDDIIGALVWTLPGIADPLALSQRLATERKNFRDAAKALDAKMTEQQTRQLTAWESQLALLGRVSRRMIARRTRIWASRQSAVDASFSESKEAIDSTRTAFLEFMKLKAPVEYWQDKASAHRLQEATARKTLYFFFPCALGGLAASFYGGANLLLLNNAHQQLPPAIYFIVSGGLATLAGLIFWIGRLLTKLYLSAHHLRHDAEERAVMTTTYLALTVDGAAADADRQIILNALFRNTSDGIVKDDVAVDPSIAGAIARLGTRPN